MNLIIIRFFLLVVVCYAQNKGEGIKLISTKYVSVEAIKAAFRSGAASFEEGTEKTLEEHGTSTKKIESSVDKAVEEVKTDADKVLAKEGTSTDQVHVIRVYIYSARINF